MICEKSATNMQCFNYNLLRNHYTQNLTKNIINVHEINASDLSVLSFVVFDDENNVIDSKTDFVSIEDY